MKKICLLLFSFVLFLTFSCDKVITFEGLPQTAQVFISDYFPDTKVSYAKTDYEFFEKRHEVFLTDGTNLEFYGNGEWKEVDCQIKAIPDGIIPSNIFDYIKTNFPDTYIRKIEKNNKNIEVELSNDLDLKFNKNGNLIEVD